MGSVSRQVSSGMAPELQLFTVQICSIVNMFLSKIVHYRVNVVPCRTGQDPGRSQQDGGEALQQDGLHSYGRILDISFTLNHSELQLGRTRPAVRSRCLLGIVDSPLNDMLHHRNSLLTGGL